MSDSTADVRRRIATVQELPVARCTRCSAKVGTVAPAYARMELPELVIHMPFCQGCIDVYLEMARDQQSRLKKR